jgi:hypothetical protein
MRNLRPIEFMLLVGILAGAGCAGLVAWWLTYSESAPLSYSGRHMLIPPVVKPGETVEIYREIIVHKKTLVEIHRYVHTSSHGVVFTYDLPMATSNKEPGVYKQHRSVMLPQKMVPGHYVMKTKVCWQPNIIKTQCTDAPDIYFEVQT